MDVNGEYGEAFGILGTIWKWWISGCLSCKRPNRPVCIIHVGFVNRITLVDAGEEDKR